jgi:hypothetical protein
MAVHRLKQYLLLLLIAMIAAACDALPMGGEPTATPLPYARHTAQDVFTAFARAGLIAGDLEQNTNVLRDAPRALRDRWVFSIERIAPAGGQVIIFADPAQQREWQAYIDRLRANANTRRDVVYTFFHVNVMVQLNAGLTNQEANAWRDALFTLP